MKHFLVEITYQVPFEELAGTVSEHRAFLQTGYERSWILMSGPQHPKTGGIVIARAPSLQDLQAFFEQDPYRIKHFASYRFVEFEPVKRQPFLEDWITAD